MKNYLNYLLIIGLFVGCSDLGSDNEVFNNATNFEEEEFLNATHRNCSSVEVLESDLIEDPELAFRMRNIEAFMQKAELDESMLRTGTTTVITIPVAVNVLYRTNAENISDAQIQSQIDALNEDFNLKNADKVLVPELFQSLRANIGIKFVWEYTSRTFVDKRSWAINHNMKKSAKGGVDPFLPNQFLNIWVVNKLQDGVLGFATFPGTQASIDGVVIAHNFFGRTGRVSPPFDKGRTATHEVGHWLNLKHIWGDGDCTVDDDVRDTPKSNQPNYGCPIFPIRHCGSVDMTMNYMDYTDDACMQMFSKGQRTRMRALFAAGGPRVGFGF